jgi:enamine deaminase RidA (YjgF/YER057c/UK114 family)
MSKVNIRKKLKEMGLELPVAAVPLAAYVPAVKTGKLVFTAGQLPMVNGAIPITGKVGAEVSVEQAKELAQICALNALAALNLVADVDDVARIVRVVGYVNGAPGFVNQPAVVNGASELLLALWGDVNGKHARSALGVAELPLNSPVEVELTFELKKK